MSDLDDEPLTSAERRQLRRRAAAIVKRDMTGPNAERIAADELGAGLLHLCASIKHQAERLTFGAKSAALALALIEKMAREGKAALQ